MLIKLSGEKKDDWDEFIDAALFSYRYFFSCLLLNMIIVLYYCFRTSQHASSKFTPFQLLYKREPRLPVDILLEPNNSEKSEDSCK